MSFPSRFPGRCARCQGAIALGQLIEYDRASKTAWHAGCPLQEALPQEGQEPGEIITTTGEIKVHKVPGRRRKLTPEEAWDRTVEHGRADIVICCRCGGSSKDGRPMLHKACLDADDVPF